MVSTQPPACSPVPTGKSRHSLDLRSSGLPRHAPPPPPPVIIGRREAGSPELHPGKCSPMFSPSGRSSEESRDCTLSLGHVFPAALPTLPLRMDRQDTSAGDFLHWDLHSPLATFSGAASSGACGFSVLLGPQPDPSRLCWGSRSGR